MTETNKRCTLLRADGTSLYMTQDIGTAIAKVEEFGLDKNIYVVADEQEHHFCCLFHILQSLGHDWAQSCYHLSYGMVDLPEGRMKSREGKVVDADDLLAEMTRMSLAEIEIRQSAIEPEAKKDLARKIALSAIKFFLLAHGSKNRVRFDPATSLSFNGKTGPYVLYAATRAKSVLDKAKGMMVPEGECGLMNSEEETALLRAIINYPSCITEAINTLEPSKVAEAVYEIAKAFNEFYQKHPILQQQAPPELIEPRLRLTQAALQVIQNGLRLLGIEDVDVM